MRNYRQVACNLVVGLAVHDVVGANHTLLEHPTASSAFCFIGLVSKQQPLAVGRLYNPC